jgi:hypothetical protein
MRHEASILHSKILGQAVIMHDAAHTAAGPWILRTCAAASVLPLPTFSAKASATAWAVAVPPVLTASARELATAVPLPDDSACAMAVAAVLAAPLRSVSGQ